MLINRIDHIIAEVAILYAKTHDELENHHLGRAIELLNKAANHLVKAQDQSNEENLTEYLEY